MSKIKGAEVDTFSCIRPEGRAELVGKRFLLVSSNPKPKKSLSEWNWKAGVIRCASHVDSEDPELQILVEYDDATWETREWLNVYKDNFHVLAVEKNLVLVPRSGHLQPALSFQLLVDSPGQFKGQKGNKVPVEFLSDLKIDFQDCNRLRVITQWDPSLKGVKNSGEIEEKVNEWTDLQRSQYLLTNLVQLVLGLRIEVYRADGTTQWYTAVTTNYNPTAHEYTLTDDTVLEEHFEDPRLTQMTVVGGRNVLESLLRGDNVIPRRSRSSVANTNQASKQPSSPPLSSRARSLPPTQEKAEKKAEKKWSKKQPQQQPSTDIDSSSESTSSSQSMSRPRGRPAKRKSQNKIEHTDSTESESIESKCDSKDQASEQQSSSSKIEDKANGPTRGRKSKKKSAGLKVGKSNSNSNSEEDKTTSEVTEAESEVEDEPLRKKTSKRTASVAALAAITDTTHKELEEEELIKSLPLVETKAKKAVAIVRPQPQQVIGAKNNNNETDRDARFSLYDFPSDSESEEQRLPTSTSGSKKDLKKVNNSNNPKQDPKQQNQGPPFKKQFTGSAPPPQTGSGSTVANSNTRGTTSRKSASSFSPKISPKVNKNNPEEDHHRQSPESNLGTSTLTSTPSTTPAINTTSITSSVNNAEKMQEDVSASGVANDHHIIRSPDSVGHLSIRPPTGSESGIASLASSSSNGADTRAGSRSSTLSSSDDSVKQVKHMENRPSAVGTQPPPGSGPPGPPGPVRPSPTSMASGMPPQPPPTSASTAAVAVAQHYAQLSQHYHAAAAMQALGAANPLAAQQAAAATQLLAAQYQQSLASLTPDMLLKQFPHLSTASLNAPPHLLGRAPGNAQAEHMHLLQAREREMAAERERQQRERREAEQRERERQAEKERLQQEKERRERAERERIERERERQNREKQISAVDAVDHHFQLSMELAKKIPAFNRLMYSQRMAASNSGPWGPMPGGKPSGSVSQTASRPAPAVITLDDERRRYENVEQARRAQDRFLNSLSHRPNQITPPPPAAHGHMRPRMAPAHSPSGLKKSEMPGSMGHLPPPPHPHGVGHHAHPGHPGPPPPLTPIQSGYNKPPLSVGAAPPGHAPPHSGVSFKPYDFPRRDQVSPRGGGGTYPNYPTAYSAPPISRSPAVQAQAQVVNVYSKPGNLPSRPESLPPTVGGGGSTPHVNGPPPAHSSLPTSSHKIPQYLPPPLASGGPHSQGSVTPSVRQPLPAPPPIAHHPLSSGANSHDDQPLDLGFAPKRKLDEESNPEAGHHHKIFKSEAGSEAGNGLLMRVSEPSALQTTETPSSITTIPNAMHNTSQVKSEPKEQQNEESPQYVHKLKKAWIKAYTDTGDNSNPSPASTPGTNRATPSPAPSNASSKSTKNSTKKVNGIHSKDMHDQSPDPAADESSDSSQAKPKSKSGSVKGKPRGSGTSSARSTPRLKKTSESDSDNSKDSDVSSRKSGSKGGRGRGRKPGTKKASNGPKTSNNLKASNEDNEDQDDLKNSIKKEKENPFNNPPISVLKKTGESFLQDADCFKVAPKLTKCRECKWSQHNKNAGSSTSIFCRFYGFRRLKYNTKNGQLQVAGFCDPHSKDDVTPDDAEMWEASADNAPDGLSVEQSKYCLELLKADFDLIISEERRAMKENIGEDNAVSWKRVVQGVSESCDVCDATLFNLHWACPRCGFVVCLHCYVGRKEQNNLLNGDSKSDTSEKSSSTSKDEKDKHSWLLCTNKSQHDLDKLMLTQIITGHALEELNKKLNNCGVKFRLANSKPKVNGHNGTNEDNKNNGTGVSLRDLIGSEQKVKMSDIIDACVEDSMEHEKQQKKLTHFQRTTDLEQDKEYRWRHGFAPKRRSYTMVETKNQYQIPHSWLANGCVLKLEGSSKDPAAVDLFQDIWSRGQPVVVANATKSLDVSKWLPNGLNEEFGDDKAEIFDIQFEESLGEHSLKKFWDGYGTVFKRIKNRTGGPAVVKLSGWPSAFGEEFKETLPNRSSEFLSQLPVPCYTGRAAPLNLAASLPDTFARAEVGPRAIITYGDIDEHSETVSKPSIALGVDRADSLIATVHAQIPKYEDMEAEEFRSKAIAVMESLGCDSSLVSKARDDPNQALPATIWTVFHPAEGDKIRDLLNKVHAENLTDDKKAKRELNFDPLVSIGSSESVGLDDKLIKRLKEEYDVKPYVIAQFPGDAVFIPAGSARQAKHLLSSISLESDFMSPENVSQSFFMYRQARHVCDAQKQSIEDKLSVKNLIFHSVKNAIATLERSKENSSEDDNLEMKPDDDEDEDEEM